MQAEFSKKKKNPGARIQKLAGREGERKAEWEFDSATQCTRIRAARQIQLQR